MTDPATTMLPVVPAQEPGSGWFEPPAVHERPYMAAADTTQLPAVAPSPRPRPESARPAEQVAQLAPLRVEITAIAPDALADLSLALRGLLYPDVGPSRHEREPAPLFDEHLDKHWAAG